MSAADQQTDLIFEFEIEQFVSNWTICSGKGHNFHKIIIPLEWAVKNNGFVLAKHRLSTGLPVSKSITFETVSYFKWNKVQMPLFFPTIKNVPPGLKEAHVGLIFWSLLEKFNTFLEKSRFKKY